METTEVNAKSNEDTCNCQADYTVIMPCSGGSNCGQIANQLAVTLDKNNIGKLYCLAGVGAHTGGMVDSVKSAQRVIVIDGCKTSCAKILTEHAGVNITDWICITDCGIKKNHTFDIPPEQIADALKYTQGILSK